MKRTMLLALLALALSLPLASAAAAHGRGGPPKPRPKPVRVCKDLRGGLFGLCVAYCEALHCELQTDRRACEVLLRLYQRASKGEAPPCVDVEEPPVASCGDGLVNQDGEECDDGNNASCDGCSFDCREEFCGDGFLCDDEECEPGDACSGDTFCGQDCACPPPPPPTPTTTCGEAAAPECNGSCPPERTCVSRDTYCECIGTSE
jgi:cysteine-rich repeat protein